MVDAVIMCLLAEVRRAVTSCHFLLVVYIPVNRLTTVHPIP